MENVRSSFNPYRYGYILEISVQNGLSSTAAKHYAMGRRANELAYVMPDRRTVYMTDDGTNTMMTRLLLIMRMISRLDNSTSQDSSR